MNVTLSIPDEFAARFAAGTIWADVALKPSPWKNSRLTKPELRRLLGLETRYALDGFLKAHGVFEAYTLRDLARDRESLKGLGL